MTQQRTIRAPEILFCYLLLVYGQYKDLQPHCLTRKCVLRTVLSENLSRDVISSNKPFFRPNVQPTKCVCVRIKTSKEQELHL